MTQIDVNTFLGRYPWRDTGECTAADLVREMLRVGTNEAWVSHVAAVYWRDPTAGNQELYIAHERESRLRPVPAVHPGLPNWSAVLDGAIARGAPAVRCDPTFYGLAPGGAELHALFAACGARGVPLMMAVRLEDLRQRHPHDVAADLPAWAVRRLVRSNPEGRLIITHADRDFIEEVHFGSTPEEASRLLWDICWIWGPPEDHLELLLHTVGIERFMFGTGMPLRLPETSVAKLDLLNLDPASRERLTYGNVRAFTTTTP
jgi:uncharacterized protein